MLRVGAVRRGRGRELGLEPDVGLCLTIQKSSPDQKNESQMLNRPSHPGPSRRHFKILPSNISEVGKLFVLGDSLVQIACQ